MIGINELVFEALQTPSTSSNDTKSSSTSSSQSQSSGTPKSSGFGSPTVNVAKSGYSFPREKQNLINQNKPIANNMNKPTNAGFLNKRKPTFGLGSGKSLMGW